METSSLRQLTEKIKQQASSLGFDLIGIAPADPHAHLSFYDQWLAKGYAGTMGYLERGRDKRSNPQWVLEGAQTLICCGLNYYRGQPKSTEHSDPERGWIARYAWGEDYHEVFLEKLKKLEEFIRTEEPNAKLKSYVDTGPILERSYAASAGLGWVGKNSCLISKEIGSFFFIGEILTDLPLIPDEATFDHCGSCTRCLDACPTQALTSYELDATKCISYLMIEHRGEIKEELRDKIGHHLVGCDICQEVCPWNREPPISQEKSFDPRPGNFHPSLETLEKLTPEEFSSRFRGSAVKRVKWEGLQRNVELIRKNN